jgi:hypothetical protein
VFPETVDPADTRVEATIAGAWRTPDMPAPAKLTGSADKATALTKAVAVAAPVQLG